MDNLSQQFALLQLADSFFPSGSYTLSHGLESLAQSGAIDSAIALETFIKILLCNKVGSTDLVALAHAYRASAQNDVTQLQYIDARLFAQTPTEKTRLAQRQSGRALLMVAEKTWSHSLLTELSEKTAQGTLHCLHPVVFAAVAQVSGLEEENAIAAFVHSFVTGLLGVGIRLGILGHVQSQQIRLNLSADMTNICHAARHLPLDKMWSCTPQIDLAQMQQAKLSRRLFSS